MLTDDFFMRLNIGDYATKDECVGRVTWVGEQELGGMPCYYAARVEWINQSPGRSPVTMEQVETWSHATVKKITPQEASRYITNIHLRPYVIPEINPANDRNPLVA